MGWSYRKSFGSGPFRVNLSKRGISYSVGVKGARLNFGPNGTFVNLSSHGLTYRQKLGAPGRPVCPGPPQRTPLAMVNIQPINSAGIGQLSDVDSRQFIEELTRKAAQLSYVIWLGIVPLMTYLILALFAGWPGYILLLFIPLIVWLKSLDKRRFELQLHYDMDNQFQQLYQQFGGCFYPGSLCLFPGVQWL